MLKGIVDHCNLLGFLYNRAGGRRHRGHHLCVKAGRSQSLLELLNLFRLVGDNIAKSIIFNGEPLFLLSQNVHLDLEFVHVCFLTIASTLCRGTVLHFPP